MSKPGLKVASMGAPPSWKFPKAISAPWSTGSWERKACLVEARGQHRVAPYDLGTLRTHIARAGLRRVDNAILVDGAIAVRMRKKILGAVGGATHVVCHFEFGEGLEASIGRNKILEVDSAQQEL
jgi:hypothetical protein